MIRDEDKTKEQLIGEVVELRRRLNMISEIVRSGRPDAEAKQERSTKLGEILVEMGYLTRAQLESALHDQQRAKVLKHEYKQLGMLLVASGVITGEQLQAALTLQLERLHNWLDIDNQGD